MKKSPKKSPAKQKTKLTDFDMTAGTDTFFDKKPKSPKRDKSNSQNSQNKKQATPKKKEPNSSSPSKDLPFTNDVKVLKNVGTAEASTAQGTCETISAGKSKSKQDKTQDSSQDGATAVFKKQEAAGKRSKAKKVLQSDDEEEEKKPPEPTEFTKKRDKKAQLKTLAKDPMEDSGQSDQGSPDKITPRSLRDRGALKRTHKEQTQQSSLQDPTQKDDDDYEQQESKPKSKSKDFLKKKSEAKNIEKDLDPVSDDLGSENELDADDEEFKEDPLNQMVMDDLEDPDGEEEDQFIPTGQTAPKKTRKKKVKAEGEDEKEESADEQGEENDDNVFIDNLPKDENSIRVLLKEVNKHIRILEQQFFDEEDSEADEALRHNLEAGDISIEDHNKQLETLKEKSHIQQFWSIPISENVMKIDFDKVAQAQMKNAGRLFDVITCDPPWQLSSANPTRGVAIAYSTLTDADILKIPLNKIQKSGFLFIWVINNKYRFALEMFATHGYRLVDEVAWVKQTVNGKIAKGHGFYLQHAKETCLVGVKGDIRSKAQFNLMSDVIFSQRRGQSQKPEEIYDLAEALIPDGYYLEIFARRNNLHNGWMSIGNEL